MRQAVIKQNLENPYLEYGNILDSNDGTYNVATQNGTVEALKAASCLIQPMVGDCVLISLDGAGRSFILSVLLRSNDENTELEFGGDVSLVCKDGGFKILADQSIQIASLQDVDVVGERAGIHAGEIKVVAGGMSFLGKKLKAEIENIKVVADKVEDVFREWTQRLGNAFRFIKEHEEIQANSTRLLVEDTVTTHAKSQVHMAEDLIKLNAGQIHLQ